MLEVTGLSVAYGGIQAVRSITFHVNEGETVALIGANGAGKTTTLKAISRMITAAGGDVHFCGEKIGGIAAHEVIRKGIALVPEGRGVFPRLSVLENLRMGAYVRDDKAAISEDIERMYGYFPRLRERADQLAGTLSGGEQQMLAIARALMTNPRLLLLDEPMEGLAPIIIQELADVVRGLIRERGLSVIVVEQHARLALSMTARAIVLDRGRIVHQSTSAELLDDDEKLSRLVAVAA